MPTANEEHHDSTLQPDLPREATFLLFEHSPLPMWVFDAKTLQFLAVNQAAIETYGYSRDEFLRMAITDIRPPDDVPLLLNALSAAPPGVRRFNTWTHTLKDGRSITVDVVATDTVFANRAAVLVVARDVTERVQAQSMLERERAEHLHQILSAQEEERRRIARELHDEAGQALTSLLVGLRGIQDAETLAAARTGAARLRGIAASVMEDLGRIAMGLHPATLDDLGLVPALARYFRDCAEWYGLQIDFNADDLRARLPGDAETALYRIIQEAVTNVARHAAARTVTVVIRHAGEAVLAEIVDDGIGFDSTVSPRDWPGHHRLGLSGIRERAALLGGTVQIASAIGEGTHIVVRIPMRRVPADAIDTEHG